MSSNTPLPKALPTKLAIVAVLALVLLIPLAMVKDLVEERQTRRDEAVAEVGSIWGKPQVITGPILAVPYRFTEISRRRQGGVESEVVTEEQAFAYFLPDTLTIKGTLVPERRYRGLYGVMVYSLPDLVVSGRFAPPDFALLDVPPEAALWGQAMLLVRIPDTRGLQSGVALDWGGKRVAFRPGTGGSELGSEGIHAPLALNREGGGDGTEFSFTLSLRGSSELSLTALGESVTAELDSTWPHPSFDGAFLPNQRQIASDGFSAGWMISRFGTSLPQAFTRRGVPNQDAWNAARFGLRLFVPVDSYQRSLRAVKYGFLFIGLTFLAFLLFEVLGGLSIHPHQYLMVGAALCLFFLLFVALSEHIGVLPGYLLAGAAVVGLITSYSATVLRTRKRAGIVMVKLTVLYGLLLVLLTNEDYALLLGSVALFAVLAAVMFLTRRIDWSLGSAKRESESDEPSEVPGPASGADA